MHAQSIDRPATRAADSTARRTWLLWLLLWAGSFFGLTLLHETSGVPAAGFGYAAAVANAALGAAAVWTYVRFLRRADELERKVQVEALALGFGVGAVGMLAYRLLERAGAPPIDVADPLLAMLAGYVVGIMLARRRYA